MRTSEPGAASTAPALADTRERGLDMANGTCSIEGCRKPALQRSWCAAHYARFKRYGDPTAKPVRALKPKVKCSIEGCTNHAQCRGWCPTHYSRWRLHGDPLGTAPPRFPPLLDRLMARIDKDGPVVVPELGQCWVWQGKRNDKGYGLFWVGPTSRCAHKWVYLEMVGPVDDGLHLDHLCRNKICCNPAHLEPVTPQENSRRARPTHCKNGHELPPFKGECWTCKLQYNKERSRRLRAEARARKELE